MKSSREVKEAATLAERQRIIKILLERRANLADMHLRPSNRQIKDELLSLYFEIDDLIKIIRGDFK